nr:homeobox-leucine zipper protein MERISTEM L1-like [Ipomoea batatas]
MLRDDEFESKSGTDIMEAPSGDDQDPNLPSNKKKRYHRHTQHQIQEMESFFKECPHPDDKQRKELGRRLALEPLQVKFWFQNKRTQMKAQHERHENSQLRAENDKLRADNIRYKEALSNATCPNCGGPATIGEMSFDEQHLRIENVRLREEIDKISAIAAKYVVAQSGEPLWVPSPDNSTEILSEDEYVRTFPRGIGPKPLGFKSEASRESAVVIMNHINLVEILMDVSQWSSVFAGIVSRALTLEVLSTGVAGNYNGALQTMTAEFQVPSPLVPTRENYFLRYCKQHGDGTWAVVDGRKSMLKLAERMVMSFCAGVGASTAHTWTTLSGSGADDVRVMTRKSIDDPGRPPGIVLSAATSFWLPVPPKRVFDFLRDENSRNEWDILSNGGLVQSANSSQSNMLILQESCTDATGSYVIYAPVDIVAMNVVLSGGDPDYVALLPSGFAILPDGPASNGAVMNPEVGSGGSLLTVAFQILVDSVPTAKLSLGSVATVNSLIKCTVERIKSAVACESA